LDSWKRQDHDQVTGTFTKEWNMGRPRELTQAERDQLIARGYRPLEIWVPDRENPAYRAEAFRQAENAAHADAEDGVMDWVEAVTSQDWDAL
jgi:Protein  of unknown function (DUF3018)